MLQPVFVKNVLRGFLTKKSQGDNIVKQLRRMN